MILYHGTGSLDIDKFDLQHMRKNGMDFGSGYI